MNKLIYLKECIFFLRLKMYFFFFLRSLNNMFLGLIFFKYMGLVFIERKVCFFINISVIFKIFLGFSKREKYVFNFFFLESKKESGEGVS